MDPIIEPLQDDLDWGRRLHTICLDTINRAKENAIMLDELPEGEVFVRKGNGVRPLLFATVQLSRLRAEVVSKVCDYTVVEQYRPAPVHIGIVWGKPYVHLYPVKGLTCEDWQAKFPPFHYGDGHQVCVGEAFRVGDATDPKRGLTKLVELLSWVNLPGAYRQLIDIAGEYGEPWHTWGTALTALRDGTPQEVFVPSGVRF